MICANELLIFNRFCLHLVDQLARQILCLGFNFYQISKNAGKLIIEFNEGQRLAFKRKGLYSAVLNRLTLAVVNHAVRNRKHHQQRVKGSLHQFTAIFLSYDWRESKLLHYLLANQIGQA